MKKILTVFHPFVTPIYMTTFAIQFARQHSGTIHAIYLSEGKNRLVVIGAFGKSAFSDFLNPTLAKNST
jgi:hypothetical protein